MAEDFKTIKTLDLAQILETASAAKEVIFISSAFIKSNTFEQLCKVSKDDCKKIVVARWQFCDLISGGSDLEAYTHANDYNWTFYFNQDLHAKFYLFDDHAFIGSSNLTNRGLGGRPPNGNIELSVQISADKELQKWFDELLQNSTKVDAKLFNAIFDDVEIYKKTEKLLPTIRKGFSQNVLSILKEREIKARLYLNDFPRTFDPNDLLKPTQIFSSSGDLIHDLSLLGLPFEPTLDNIKKAFEILPGFAWLLSVVKSSMFFGELTSHLHDALCDEPKPFRKEVKERLGNLINWAAVICPESFYIDRPNYSQRISRVKK